MSTTIESTVRQISYFETDLVTVVPRSLPSLGCWNAAMVRSGWRHDKRLSCLFVEIVVHVWLHNPPYLQH